MVSIYQHSSSYQQFFAGDMLLFFLTRKSINYFLVMHFNTYLLGTSEYLFRGEKKCQAFVTAGKAGKVVMYQFGDKYFTCIYISPASTTKFVPPACL
jgi:hypothetical protein